MAAAQREKKEKQAEFDRRAMAEGLTKPQLKEFKEAFALFDVDGDGEITLKELEHVMKSFGMKPSEKELKDMIADVDVNHSGTVDFWEFLTMMKRQVSDSIPEKDIMECFQLFDRNNDGFISRKELMLALQGMGEPVSPAEAVMLIGEADRDGDKRLSYEEFAWLIHTDPTSIKLAVTAENLVPEVLTSLMQTTNYTGENNN